MASFVQKVSKFSANLGRSKGKANFSKRFFHEYTKQLAQPLPKKPAFVSAEEALRALDSGNTVFVQGAAATPITLVKAMTEQGKAAKLKDIKVCHMHTEGDGDYMKPDCAGIFRSVSFFIAANARNSISDGRSDCISIFLSDIPKLFHRGIYRPDISLIHVSPPDEHGYCSLGTSVDCVKAALVYSKKIIAQVNPQMPRTFGDAIIHSSHIDYAVNVDHKLPQHGGKPPTDVEGRIAKHIAENLVEDGATLQMGIGNIPDAVLASLTGHKDLGIHTEMFSAGVIDLVNRGCITNNKKRLHRGKIVSSFLIGTQKLYEFINNNPFVEMYEVDYTNSTYIISQMPKMTAINSCIEVDLTGQVVSDSIGTRMYSGFGGQVDFLKGAADGFDGKGKPILAFPSSAKGISRIVPYIKTGAGVVTTRAHVGYLVTEYGVADLFGKTFRQRAYELIQIAHPDHREALEKAAFERLKVMPAK